MVTLFIVRHGQTKWNEEGRLQGWKNSDLTNIGSLNAERLGKRLKDVEFNNIYVSPSGRARETLDRFNVSNGVPVHILDGMNEISFGDWEGKKENDIHPIEAFHSFWQKPSHYDHAAHNAESLEGFLNRVSRSFHQILDSNPHGNVLLVTHGMVIQAILKVVRGVDTSQLWFQEEIDGTSLTVIHHSEGGYTEHLIGDVTHQADCKK